MESKELLLSGSGVLAYAHIGVLRALEEKKVSVGAVSGSSTSALIATLIANGETSSGIHELFQDKHPQRFDSAAWLGSRNGCLKDQRMFCPIVDLVPTAEQFVRANRLTPKEGLRIICYDLLGEKPYVFEGTHYDLALALAASCAVPGISRPVRTGEHLLVDIATRSWRLKSQCGKRAIVSHAAYHGDETDLLTRLDKWLRLRQFLLQAPGPDATTCGDRIVIETKLSSDIGCGCKTGEAAREAVIVAGYEACKSIVPRETSGD